MRQSIGRRSVVSDWISNTPRTDIAGTTSAARNTVPRGSMNASTPDSPATARIPSDKKMRPSTCTMPRSARTSASGRGLPSASTRGTTSVDIASATTSWITVPSTISIEPST